MRFLNVAVTRGHFPLRPLFATEQHITPTLIQIVLHSKMSSGASNPIQKICSVETMYEWRKSHRGSGVRVGLVLALGGLKSHHSGAIISCVGKVDELVVAILATPDEFLQKLEAEPPSAAEESTLHSLGVKVIFNPPAKSIYPQDFRTRIAVEGLAIDANTSPAFVNGAGSAVHQMLYIIEPDVMFFSKADQKVADIHPA